MLIRRSRIVPRLPFVACLVVGLGLLTHAHAQSLPVLQPSGFIDPPGDESAVNGFAIHVNDGRALIGLASNTFPIRNGEVFAYSRDASGAWQPGVFAFGNSIAIGPSHVGFGAHFSNSGTAFVYETTAGGLVPAAVILGQPFLGEQMFFDDTTLLISSPAEALVHLYEPAL
jgi:hypothetical protein